MFHSTMKIDIVMITKNSVHPCLKESVESISRNLPVHCFIVVDSMSTDATIQSIEKYQKKAGRTRFIRQDCKRGRAREIGAKEVDTEWFAFVDSDVVLAENWFEEIRKYIRPKVGAIEGNVMTSQGKIQSIRPHDRAYTNCTLIKTSLVEDIKIPKEMNFYEDQFIRKYIEGQGYEWIKVPKPCSIHMSHRRRFPKVEIAFEIGRMAGKYNLLPFWMNFFSFALTPIQVFRKRKMPIVHWYKLLGHIRGILERVSGET